MRTFFLPLILLATPAAADLSVVFDEGAPKDRFTLTNASACALSDTTVTIDLNGSAGGLIFDVTGEGAGVEVFQPFELVGGPATLQAMPMVKDGDTAIALEIVDLPPGGALAFTIDVDDTVGTRAITVSGGEIEGASVRVGDEIALFGTSATAVLMRGCPS